MINFKKNIWIYGVIGVFAAFATLMISFAVIARHHTDALVITDYYKAEIEYQQQIDKMKNLARIGHSPLIYLEDHYLKIQLPAVLSDSINQGKLSFYRANNAEQDIKMQMEVSPGGVQLIDISSLERGRWKISMDWTSGHLPYFYQQSFTIR
jgi:hypothetical protein